jgi:uncharacterized protein YbjT (DUF2867 family)
LTHHWLNFVSARNVAHMCVSDGVPHMVLMSSARAPWINRQYLRAKREAEGYMTRVGLNATIIRAPVAYVRGARRHPFMWLMTVLGSTPVIAWFGFGRIGPMPVDMLARGVARITLEKDRAKTFYYAADLRRRNTAREARQARLILPGEPEPGGPPLRPFDLLDEETPFGWQPPDRRE